MGERQGERQVRRGKRDKRATEGGLRPAHQPLPPHPPGRGFRHRREIAQRLPRCRRDGELHPQRLREHEPGVRGDGGERAASQVHLQQVSGCLQPFQDLPLGEEEAHRHGLQGADQGDHHRFRQVPAGGERTECQHPLDIHHAPAQPDRQGVAAGHRPHRPLRRVQP